MSLELFRCPLRDLSLTVAPSAVLPTAKRRPPTTKRWLILGGVIDHINLTETRVDVEDNSFKPTQQVGLVAAASASRGYPCPNNGQAEINASPQTWIIDDSHYLALYGDATATARIIVLEF